MTENINNVIALQLKQARSDKAWSLDKTSKMTGVSKAMLGQIERGESSPTITRLWKIATGFELPLSHFLSTNSNNEVSIKASKEDQGMVIDTLFTYDKNTNIEVFSITLMPLHEQKSAPHNRGVIEHILVLEGDMEYLQDGQWRHLCKGEVVKFNANKEHGYRNICNKKAVFHNIIHYAL